MHSPRNGGHQLPAATELFDILEHESPRRSVRTDYLQQHADMFTAYRRLSDQAAADCRWIDTFSHTTLDVLVDEISICNQKIAEYITKNQNDTKLFTPVYLSLAPTDDRTPSDLIFVHGAASSARIDKAIELYRQGIAPKILISGNRPFYDQTSEPEALRMAVIARAAGVPEDDLIIEAASITIPDNVKRSIDMLERLGWQPASVTTIATPYVLERSRSEWYKFAPWEMAVKTVAADIQEPRFSAKQWHTDQQVIKLILNEYAKMVLEARIDQLRTANAKV